VDLVVTEFVYFDLIVCSCWLPSY